jgi:hypothetical protein
MSNRSVGTGRVHLGSPELPLELRDPGRLVLGPFGLLGGADSTL